MQINRVVVAVILLCGLGLPPGTLVANNAASLGIAEDTIAGPEGAFSDRVSAPGIVPDLGGLLSPQEIEALNRRSTDARSTDATQDSELELQLVNLASDPKASDIGLSHHGERVGDGRARVILLIGGTAILMFLSISLIRGGRESWGWYTLGWMLAGIMLPFRAAKWCRQNIDWSLGGEYDHGHDRWFTADRRGSFGGEDSGSIPLGRNEDYPG